MLSRGQPSKVARCADMPSPLGSRDYEAPHEQVCGIVLAGSYHWGDDAFGRMLRGPLLPVAQLPLICYPLRWLRAHGVQRATICANSSTPAVRGYLGAGRALSMELDYVEDHEPRGPAGCVRDAVQTSTAETFVVAEGALIPSFDLTALLDAHKRSGAVATVAVETDRRRHAVGGEPHRLPGGVYVFDRSVLDTIPDRGFHDIKQGLLDRLYTEGARVLTHEMPGISPRVLDYATYTSVSRWLIARAAERPEHLAAYQRVGEGLRHPTAEVDETAQIIGPVIIGPRARVEADAVLVGPTTIGADSVVESHAVVSRSIVWEGCRVSAGAVVDAALLADEAHVAAGEQLFSEFRILGATRAPSDPPVFAAPDLIHVPADFSLRFQRPSARTSRPVVLPPTPSQLEVRA
jgi:NDP-sugar pyrophosphorylase family protein